MQNSVVDINDIYKKIENISLFDLTRLNFVIRQLINNEDKNVNIKRHLNVGMQISYFHSRHNDIYDGVVLSIAKSKARIKNLIDDKIWLVPFSAINISEKDITHIQKRNTKNLDKYSLSIGAHVGFNNNGRDIFGVVKKLNPKTAVIELADGHIWHVYYGGLFLVMDGVAHTSQNMLFIEGEVIND